MVQDINQIILDVVATELRKEGHKIDEQAMDRATETMNQDWRSTAPSASATTRTTS